MHHSNSSETSSLLEYDVSSVYSTRSRLNAEAKKHTPILFLKWALLIAASFSVFLLLSRSQCHADAATGGHNDYDWSARHRVAGQGTHNVEGNHSSEWTWTAPIRGEHCLKYGTREYRAQLVHLWDTDPDRGPRSAHRGCRPRIPRIPPRFASLSSYSSSSATLGKVVSPRVAAQSSVPSEMMKACETTPLEVEGRTLLPNFCEDLGFKRGVWGFWPIEFGNGRVGCEPSWGPFIDMGCERIPAGSRRFRSHLENLDQASNWQIMCLTTPVTTKAPFAVKQGPDSCTIEKLKVFGEWLVHDASCQSDP